jgi:hypothetical protein
MSGLIKEEEYNWNDMDCSSPIIQRTLFKHDDTYYDPSKAAVFEFSTAKYTSLTKYTGESLSMEIGQPYICIIFSEHLWLEIIDPEEMSKVREWCELHRRG